MKSIAKLFGPAIIVSAVVLGPGSILTCSKVGAIFGWWGIPVLVISSILLIAMVALASRIGVVYDGSPGDELARRWGRPATIAIGVVLFTLIALFQSSNNIAVVGAIEPLLNVEQLPAAWRVTILVAINAVVIVCLYYLRDLYHQVEWLMKVMVGGMTIAFVCNFILVASSRRPTSSMQVQTVGSGAFTEIDSTLTSADWFALLGMVATTFSVAGAFYQAYLVREKGWTVADTRRGVMDSLAGIAALAVVCIVILSTAALVFYQTPPSKDLTSIGSIARMLEPLFGVGSKWIFCLGILAGGASSFLVNALIGGTILSDTLGRGSRLSQPWPLHLTTAALLVGMSVAIASLVRENSTVLLITIAQSLTVLGIPALAASLLYLGTRQELTGPRRIPAWILRTAALGFIVSLGLAALTTWKILTGLVGSG